MRRSARDDGGSAVLEMVVLLPVYMAFVMAVVVVGKLNNSSATIEAAARSAARTISIAEDPEAAEGQAEELARDMVDVGSAFCTEMTFPKPEYGAGLADVTVTIECTVDLQQASFIGVPGTRQMTATATEIIDIHRERP